jgi:beta-glucanase (GH16 family)
MITSYRLRTIFAAIVPIAIFPLAIVLPNQPTVAEDMSWKLVWSDEFDGQRLDYSKWEVEVNSFGGGNNELQLYTDRKENLRVENGNLVLEARHDEPNVQGTTREYSSARIRSKNRGDWKFGRFEFRTMLPRGQGLWPAIWMMPSEDIYGSWARSGEIDIMEFKGQEDNQVWGTLHYGGAVPDNKHSSGQYRLKSGNFCDQFHTFAIEWESESIRWYVEDVLYQEQKQWNSAGGDYPAPFDQQFHLIINLAVGGGFVGELGPSTKFPAQFLIDYVRVYQRP